jgi:nucleoside-diphosphate-sugar epimerase
MMIGHSILVFIVFLISSSLSYIVVSKNSPLPVFITGDINGIGRSVVEALTNQGIPVKALVPKAIKANNLEGLKLVSTFVGDSTDEEAVQSCMSGCIAAISMVKGTTDGDGSSKLDYAGNSNVVEQVRISCRLVCIYLFCLFVCLFVC